MRRHFIVLLFVISFGICKTQAQFTVLHNFNGATGVSPIGSLAISGNVLYGMTWKGGLYDSGCVFSVNTNGSGYKDILDFNGPNGAAPQGSVIIVGNKLYGMTWKGGSNHVGCIFSLNTNGTAYTKLLDFNNANGATPYGDLMLSGKLLYGMTFLGGAHNTGCIFSIDTNGSGYTDIFDFISNTTTGTNPYGSLTLSGNVLYGEASAGGAAPYYWYGNVFSLHTDGSGYKIVLNFNGTNGYGPLYNLLLSGKTLYGTAQTGGANNNGTIFSIDTNGNNYRDVFDFNGTNGKAPQSLLLSGGILYGVGNLGGANNYGDIFSIDTGGKAFTDIFDFNVSNGWSPTGIILSGNTLYGMTALGGTYDSGIIFGYVDTAVGINELKVESEKLKVYPNPSNGLFTIKSSVASGQSSVEVYNMLGQQVYSQYTLPNTQYQIDISNQPTGIYFYRVISENGNVVGEGKLIIVR